MGRVTTQEEKTMAKKTSLECDGCQNPIAETEVEVLLLGIPTGKFDDKLSMIYADVHACKGCSESLTLAQLNVKLRSRPQ